MDDDALSEHLDIMRSGGFVLDRDEFAHLKSWHGVLFQAFTAKFALSKLKSHEHKNGDLANIHEQLAMFSYFVMEYGKCFASAGNGQVSLDERKVFNGNALAAAAHQRILTLRNKFVAHNGGSDLVRHTIAVKEDADRFVVRHLTSTAIPGNEFEEFNDTLDVLTQYLVARMNNHLDSLQDKLGKEIHLNSD